MSLRPSLSSFSLPALNGLIGSGNQKVEVALLRRIHEDHENNSELRRRAAEIVRTIIHRGRATAYAPEEDEEFQRVVDMTARYGQTHGHATHVFWEQLFANVGSLQISSAEPEGLELLRALIAGRGLFGRNVSRWAHYSFLTTDEAARVRDFIRANPALVEAPDVGDALDWLDATCGAQRDIWCWVA